MNMNIREFIEEKKKKMQFEQLHTDKYIKLFEKNGKDLETLMTYYECALMEIETKLKVLNAEFELTREYSPIETIKSRLKSLDSLIAKSHLYEVKPTFEDIQDKIEDIAGIRVICGFPEDIYTVADCILQQDDIQLIDCKDYIKNPKPNGYRSLHLIISVPRSRSSCVPSPWTSGQVWSTSSNTRRSSLLTSTTDWSKNCSSAPLPALRWT